MDPMGFTTANYPCFVYQESKEVKEPEEKPVEAPKKATASS